MIALLENIEQLLAAGAAGFVGLCLIQPKIFPHERPITVVVAENPRFVPMGCDPSGDLLSDKPPIRGAEDIGTSCAGLQLNLMLDQRDMDRVGNFGFAVDSVREVGVIVAGGNPLQAVGAGPEAVETQCAHLADAVAHPLFLTVAVDKCDGSLRHACDRMTETHAKEAVSVGRDQPPAIVDAFGVEETSSLPLDIDGAAVAIELWPVGYRIPTEFRRACDGDRFRTPDCSMAVWQ